jgi:hypothetical protein
LTKTVGPGLSDGHKLPHICYYDPATEKVPDQENGKMAETLALEVSNRPPGAVSL